MRRQMILFLANNYLKNSYLSNKLVFLGIKYIPNTTIMPKTIIIIGNTPLFMLGLEQYLTNHHYSIQACFLDCKDAYHNIKKHQNTIILVELIGDHRSDFKKMRCLINLFPESSIMILKNEATPKHIKAYFQLGVKAYAPKSILPESLQEAILFLNKGQTFLDPQISQNWIDTSMGLHTQPKKLTRRESEVLQLIIEEHTTKEIAKKLFISPCTAETHRINIIQKLGVRNTAGMVREAVSLGLCG